MPIVVTPDPNARLKAFQSARISEPLLVLVEGSDDQGLVAAVAPTVGVHDIQIVDMNGHTSWGRELAAVALNDEFRNNVRSVGLMQDADNDGTAAFQRCVGALRQANLPEPPRPLEVVSDGKIRCAVMVVPEIARNGAVEELVLDSLAGDERLGRARAYLQDLEDGGFGGPEKASKTLMLAYQAGMPRYARSISMGFRAQHFDPNSTAFDSVREFLVGLAEA